MLALTENATTVIREIVETSTLADGAGLRITTARNNGTAGLTVATADSPADHDIVVEDHGARVFLTSDAALMLDGKILDARFDDGGEVKFLVATIQ
jgi:iron-sulfur cluster assembly protein